MILTSAVATGSVLCVTPAARSQPAASSERERVLGEFLASFWQWPLRPQGSPPAGFSAADASLDPQICGACHPKQHHEWRDSLHARAFSSGLAGQLIEGPLATSLEVRGCQRCHAPLAEQQPFDAQGQEVAHDPALRSQGVVCAACHVRAHRRYGPLRRPEPQASSFRAPHWGFEARVEFEESRFCAPCHQFFDDPGIDGTPVENTLREWQESPHAARTQTCQSCHRGLIIEVRGV